MGVLLRVPRPSASSFYLRKTPTPYLLLEGVGEAVVRGFQGPTDALFQVCWVVRFAEVKEEAMLAWPGDTQQNVQPNGSPTKATQACEFQQRAKKPCNR